MQRYTRTASVAPYGDTRMDLLRDVRLTIHHLLKQPGYTSASIVTLALAIGANSAIFGAVHAILFKPLPIRQPNELVICWGADPSHNLAVAELSYTTFQDWATHSRSFTEAAAIGSSTWPGALEGRGEPVRVSTAGVSASFFDTLGTFRDSPMSQSTYRSPRLRL
jgi:hypothetical protein